MNFNEYFSSACGLNGLSEFVSKAGIFEALTARLLEFNQHTNLTAVRSEEDVIVRHYIDSMTALRYIPDSAETLIDVGCGGGFPCLPVSICRPGLKITALDSTEKKLRFVSEAASGLSLPVSVLCGRAEEIGRDEAYREKFDAVSARAVARLNILCELCLPLARVGGVFIAMKGPGGDEEVREAKIACAALGGEIADVSHIVLCPPGGGESMERVIVVIEKLRETPDGYPRQYAKISKRPL